MKKRIAVIISDLRFEGQTLTVKGLLDGATDYDYEVFIFTCDNSWDQTPDRGGILPLFCPCDYDGIIFHGDTIWNDRFKKPLIREITDSGVPAVTIKDSQEGMMLAGMDNVTGIKEIVEHLYSVHGVRTMNFVAGVPGNIDSEERLAAFREACSELSVEVNDKRIETGWFTPQGGRDAFRKWYEKREELPLPEAIICASDWMAVGVMEEASKHGVRVPDDILVTGFDDTRMSRISAPSITTVSLPNYRIGRLAIDKMHDLLEKGFSERPDRIDNHAIFRESCGCRSEGTADVERSRELKEFYFRESLHKTDYMDSLKAAQIDFAGADGWDAFYRLVADSALVFKADAFFMCTTLPHQSRSGALAEIIDEGAGKLTYTGDVEVPVAIIKGREEHFRPFSDRYLMSEEMLSAAAGQYYGILPLQYHSNRFGYCIVCNSEAAYESEFFNLYMQTISSAMQNLWVKSRLSKMIEILDELWIYDRLTKVMNREGFYRYAPHIIEEAAEEGSSVFVLFADLDGLKTVNDNIGHDAGDAYIVKAAEILRNLHRKGELMMRYGGDEFVVLAKGYTARDAESYRERIASAAAEEDKNEPDYEISMSTGYSLHMADEGMTLEEMIEEADMRMLQHKAERHKSR